MNNDITCSKCGVTFGGSTFEIAENMFRDHDQRVHNYMTGQEFYDRFSKGLSNYDSQLDSLTPEQMLCILECAKKAAGLEGGDE